MTPDVSPRTPLSTPSNKNSHYQIGYSHNEINMDNITTNNIYINNLINNNINNEYIINNLSNHHNCTSSHNFFCSDSTYCTPLNSSIMSPSINNNNHNTCHDPNSGHRRNANAVTTSVVVSDADAARSRHGVLAPIYSDLTHLDHPSAASESECGEQPAEAGGVAGGKPPKKSKKKKTLDRFPKLLVLNVTGTVVECQLESMTQKTVKFLFDVTEDLPQDVANNLVS